MTLIATSAAVFNPLKLAESDGDVLTVRSFGDPNPIHNKLTTRQFTNQTLTNTTSEPSKYSKSHVKRAMVIV